MRAITVRWRLPSTRGRRQGRFRRPSEGSTRESARFERSSTGSTRESTRSERSSKGSPPESARFRVMNSGGAAGTSLLHRVIPRVRRGPRRIARGSREAPRDIGSSRGHGGDPGGTSARHAVTTQIAAGRRARHAVTTRSPKRGRGRPPTPGFAPQRRRRHGTVSPFMRKNFAAKCKLLKLVGVYISRGSRKSAWSGGFDAATRDLTAAALQILLPRARLLARSPTSSEASPQTAKPASVAVESETRRGRLAFGFHRQLESVFRGPAFRRCRSGPPERSAGCQRWRAARTHTVTARIRDVSPCQLTARLGACCANEISDLLWQRAHSAAGLGREAPPKAEVFGAV